MRPIDEIAAELSNAGPNLHAAALRQIRDLDRRPDLDHADRWRETARIVDAVDLVETLRLGGALGAYDDPA